MRRSLSDGKKTWLSRSTYITAVSVLLIILGTYLLVGKNDLHNWQVIQHFNGKVVIRNKPGWYLKLGAKISTYPRMITVFGTKSVKEGSPKDDSVKVRFNDGGSADISWVARITTPCLENDAEYTPEEIAQVLQQQRNFHRQFTGNVENAHDAVRSVSRNVLTQSGPIMSSTENQAARKGEFWRVIHNQLREGLYTMRPIEVKRETGVGEMIKAIEKKEGEIESGVEGSEAITTVPPLLEESITVSETVLAAEIVYDSETGKPVISTASPLKEYGMKILQFSIIETPYDNETLKKFSDKKKLYLASEKSKAKAIESVQTRFRTIAEGERKVAETEWTAEEKRTREQIIATTAQEKALTVKETLRIEAETLALVEEVKKREEGIKRDIAVVEAKTAVNDKKAAEILASARERQIEIGGAISDHDKLLAEIIKEGETNVAKAFEQLQVPDIVIMTPEAFDPKKGTAMQQAMPSMQVLQIFGLLEENKDLVVPAREVLPKKADPVASSKKEEVENKTVTVAAGS